LTQVNASAVHEALFLPGGIARSYDPLSITGGSNAHHKGAFIMRSTRLAATLCAVALFIAGAASAQQMPNPYGPSINLATAKKVAAAAAAKAAEMKLNMVFAVVDTGGHLVTSSARRGAVGKQ
jgi:hypothetical protein